MTIKAWVDSNSDGVPDSSLSLSEIQSEFGGSAPISFSEYYRGGANVPSGVIGYPGGSATYIPSSGGISVSNFYGSVKNPYRYYYTGLRSPAYIGYSDITYNGEAFRDYVFRLSIPELAGNEGRHVFLNLSSFENSSITDMYYMPYIRFNDTSSSSLIYDHSPVEHWDEWYRQLYLQSSLGVNQTTIDLHIGMRLSYDAKSGGIYPLFDLSRNSGFINNIVLVIVSGVGSYSTTPYSAGYGENLSVSIPAPGAFPLSNSFVMTNAVNNFADGTGATLLNTANLDAWEDNRYRGLGFDAAMSASPLSYGTLSGKQQWFSAIRVTWSS